MDLTIDADRTTLLVDHRKHDPVVEDDELEEVVYADEGRVVNAVRDGGRMRGTDAEVWNRAFHVWTFRDGRIVRLSVHTDRARALEVAGLST